MNPTNVTVSLVGMNSPMLQKVIDLGREHRATLGFMPHGGFQDHAEKKCILAAIEGDRVCGYLMFRISREEAVIVHLCIRPDCQRSGVARKLFNEFRNRTVHLRAAVLRCRRDFPADALWPKLGFVAYGESPGRSEAGKILTHWRLNYGEVNLFSDQAAVDHARLGVVMDANIVYAINPINGEDKPEAKALLADWLGELVELRVTEEMFNEINRHADQSKRTSSKAFIQSFNPISTSPDEFDKAQALLKPFFAGRSRTSDDSDFRQLVHAIANNMTAFVTCDGPLLELSDSVFEKFGLRILRPSELIVQLDTLENEEAYRPSSLAGTHIQLKRATANLDESWGRVFQNTKTGETQGAFRKVINDAFAQTEYFRVLEVLGGEGEPLALFILDWSKSHELRIPLLRICESKMSSTLARHILFYFAKRAVEKGRSIVRIFDRCIQPIFADAVSIEFRPNAFGDWIKVCLKGIGTGQNASDMLTTLSQMTSEPLALLNPVADSLNDPAKFKASTTAWNFERDFWPYKLSDGNQRSFIISIQPRWAKHLIDQRLAEDELLKADPAVATNRECVYYRSSYQKQPVPFSRVLWYVSGEVGQICAASLVSEVEIGTAKELFRKNRRYGVYHWNDVLEKADGDPMGNLMAVRFSETEEFKKPIPRLDVEKILKGYSINTMFLSPTEIPTAAFLQLYQQGLSKGS